MKTSCTQAHHTQFSEWISHAHTLSQLTLYILSSIHLALRVFLNPFMHHSHNIYYSAILLTMDYERPMKLFFYRNPKLFGLGRQIGQITSGIFSAKLSSPILVHVLCPCLPLFNRYFYKKLSLYIKFFKYSGI